MLFTETNIKYLDTYLLDFSHFLSISKDVFSFKIAGEAWEFFLEESYLAKRNSARLGDALHSVIMRCPQFLLSRYCVECLIGLPIYPA